jgi:hypothetical protein
MAGRYHHQLDYSWRPSVANADLGRGFCYSSAIAEASIIPQARLRRHIQSLVATENESPSSIHFLDVAHSASSTFAVASSTIAVGSSTIAVGSSTCDVGRTTCAAGRTFRHPKTWILIRGIGHERQAPLLRFLGGSHQHRLFEFSILLTDIATLPVGTISIRTGPAIFSRTNVSAHWAPQS